MARILQKASRTISELPPSCSQKSMLVSYVTDPTQATVNLVLTLDGGQMRAYIGYPDKKYLKPPYSLSEEVLHNCTKIRSHDQVAWLGDRLDEDSKFVIFPTSRLGASR